MRTEYLKSALKRLQRAEEFYDKDFFEETLVYAHWAVELAMRDHLARYGLDVAILDYSELCDNMLRFGTIDREDRERLRWLGERRNLAYHRAGAVSKAEAGEALDLARRQVEKFRLK